MVKKIFWSISGLAILVSSYYATLASISPVVALNFSVGEPGINARRLHEPPYNLLGRKIAIGQVEIGRPGKFGLDKAGSLNQAIAPRAVFFRDRPAASEENLDNHAIQVAGVMIGEDKKLRGVAPKANLYASAVGSFASGGQAQECLASQHVALQNSGDLRAINFSFGESLERDSRDEAKLDGKALLTECIDWSARVHDTLYVIAGNQGRGGIPIPTDHFNGITTAYSTKRQGKFIKVDFANLSSFPQGIGRSTIAREINFGDRRAISLVAPGSQIEVYNQKGKSERTSGTSFAAPHITASVALLQEHGDRNISQSLPNWSLDARRHEVMKAVLLNSADKIQEQGDGLLLDMERTVLSEKNQTWLDSDAYKNPRVPLDIEMGTGHLNVFRGYQQFSGGQYAPEFLAPAIAWDYNQVKVGNYQDYYLKQPLEAGSYAAISLAWDRLVLLNDRNRNDKYDVEETFLDRGLNNLDLYLLPANESSDLRNICSSNSFEDSVEHIFCKIPETGRYKIRVYYRHQLNDPIQFYGLAWWTKSKE
ncbi:subtilisin-like serine protease [Xenococcus sp. PCC 7305]|nr:S8 family serine peptidase [Xenococcus sp. PCC 7305]ELS02086.1 subtilisin-like serine protease [Xenococcus sp. PCC 7305]